MTYEIVVVGGGIGGLTIAALLAARGLSVCLFEREAQGGGCAVPFEQFGYRFEAGAGLYASWHPGGIHERVFAELPVAAPAVDRVSPAYVVRLPDMTDINPGGTDYEFEAELAAKFPECANRAIAFYREIAPVAAALQRTAERVPDLVGASKLQRLRLMAREAGVAACVLSTMNHTTAQHLTGTSPRFKSFIDAQLQIFAQCPSDECAYLYAAIALAQPRRGMYTVKDGAAALTAALTEAIRRSGGTVRFNAPVLRLAYDSAGGAVGVDLLSGETVLATRAIVSNLPVWDTYGKLVGLRRTPPRVRARLKNLRGWGAYLLYLGIDDAALALLPAERVLALTNRPGAGEQFDPRNSLLMFGAAPAAARAPAGKRPVTVSTFTEAEQWFAFHQDETAHEAQDQAMLEAWWGRLHTALPELGDRIEVIETATPRTFYQQTRRKLGMVGGVGQSLDVFGDNALTCRTSLPNLFMVGDTTFPGQGIAAVTHSALITANKIAPPIK